MFLTISQLVTHEVFILVVLLIYYRFLVDVILYLNYNFHIFNGVISYIFNFR